MNIKELMKSKPIRESIIAFKKTRRKVAKKFKITQKKAGKFIGMSTEYDPKDEKEMMNIIEEMIGEE